LKRLLYFFGRHEATFLYRGSEAAVPATIPADRSKGKKHVSGEGNDAALHIKRILIASIER
jgi:hypothetical protein